MSVPKKKLTALERKELVERMAKKYSVNKSHPSSSGKDASENMSELQKSILRTLRDDTGLSFQSVVMELSPPSKMSREVDLADQNPVKTRPPIPEGTFKLLDKIRSQKERVDVSKRRRSAHLETLQVDRAPMEEAEHGGVTNGQIIFNEDATDAEKMPVLQMDRSLLDSENDGDISRIVASPDGMSSPAATADEEELWHQKWQNVRPASPQPPTFGDTMDPNPTDDLEIDIPNEVPKDNVKNVNDDAEIAVEFDPEEQELMKNDKTKDAISSSEAKEVQEPATETEPQEHIELEEMEAEDAEASRMSQFLMLRWEQSQATFDDPSSEVVRNLFDPVEEGVGSCDASLDQFAVPLPPTTNAALLSQQLESIENTARFGKPKSRKRKLSFIDPNAVSISAAERSEHQRMAETLKRQNAYSNSAVCTPVIYGEDSVAYPSSPTTPSSSFPSGAIAHSQPDDSLFSVLSAAPASISKNAQ